MLGPIESERRPPRIVKAASSVAATALTASLSGFLIFALLQSGDQLHTHKLVIATLCVNGALSIYGQSLAMSRETPLHFMSFIFAYLFMSIAPLVQIGAKLDPVFDMGSVPALAALSASVFTLIGLISMRGSKRAAVPDSQLPFQEGEHYLSLFLITLIFAAATFVLYRSSLFTSREGFSLAQAKIFSDQPTALLVSTFLMSIPFFGATMGLRAAISRRRTVWVVMFSVELAIAMVINNPLIHPRFKLAGLAVFFIDYMFRKRRMQLLSAFVIVGVIVAPLFNVFRYEAGGVEDDWRGGRSIISESLLTYDYDAFQTLSYAFVKVREDGLSWGDNIAGAVLFFVPRTMWPGKPLPTSWVLFDTMQRYREVGTNNLSTPLFAEGYLAFGWVGAGSISIVYWWLVSTLNRRRQENGMSFSFLLHAVLAGLVLILLRGTLTVGLDAVVGSFASAAVPWLIFGVTRRSR